MTGTIAKEWVVLRWGGCDGVRGDVCFVTKVFLKKKEEIGEGESWIEHQVIY
jgi:hypothetical protein